LAPNATVETDKIKKIYIKYRIIKYSFLIGPMVVLICKKSAPLQSLSHRGAQISGYITKKLFQGNTRNTSSPDMAAWNLKRLEFAEI
jgi:hypothetical protein